MTVGGAVLRRTVSARAPEGAHPPKPAQFYLGVEVCRMPLVGGQMEPPDRPYSRSLGQILFLKVVRVEVPEVLTGLHEKVLPVYSAAVDARRPDAVRLLRASSTFLPHLLPIKEALLDWAHDYPLTDVWLLDVALRTCEQWGVLTIGAEYTDEDGNPQVLTEADYLRWGPIGSHSHEMPLPESDTRMEFDREGSRVAVEVDLFLRTRAVEERRLMKAGMLRGSARKELTTLARKLGELGYIDTPEKRDTDGLLLHFEMLALYQCRRVEIPELARGLPSTDVRGPRAGVFPHGQGAIRKALRSTAALIGLELRVVPPGGARRKGSGVR